jgi:dihydrodipicolinate synthase/N-acetylneuraminate lyase
VIGFYLQPTLGKMILPYEFWKEFAKIPNAVAIKIAPFNRYQTFDVVRAVIDSGREDLALYTGNDDNIIADLLTPWEINGQKRFIAGGLLGQFGVWTKKAVEFLDEIKVARKEKKIPLDWLTKNAALTDANSAVFDPANQFKGVLPGIHEVLRRQGLFSTVHCLDPNIKLSPGQSEELDRVSLAYPWLLDDDFVKQNKARWFND